MEFEFDKRKSESNREKHGIDFVQAQALWEDPDRLEVPVRTKEEKRFILIGKIDQKFWSVVFTFHNDKIRIISVPRSRIQEVEAYES